MDFYESILIEAGYIADKTEARYLATHEGMKIYGIPSGIVAINPDTGRIIFEAYL